MATSGLAGPSAWSRGLVLLSIFAAFAAHAGIPTSEREALTNFYSSTNGPEWINRSNWNGVAGTECAWFGVTCDGTQSHVTSIELAGNNLSGTLPSLAPLTNLQTLDVSTNRLTGGIPALSGLTNLQNFYAYSNQLSGSIPPIAGLEQLGYFYVYGNRLTGMIPDLSDMPTLCHFNVSDNQLSGSIPGIEQLTSLVVFNVRGNLLSGSIPPLFGLSSLSLFNVGANKLTGSVPDAPSGLAGGESGLCPNSLIMSGGAAWDAATGYSPWWATPDSTNQCDDMFTDGFD
jgi:Leucine-rich repeat (LRR) protein